MLPFVVAILFAMPVLQGGAGGDETTLSSNTTLSNTRGDPVTMVTNRPAGGASRTAYLFLSWALAVGVTFVLSRRLSRVDSDPVPEDGQQNGAVVLRSAGDVLPDDGRLRAAPQTATRPEQG